MHVEQAFGVLVARWGILWTPLQFDLQRSTQIVDVALKLHNYCIGEKEECISISTSAADRQKALDKFAW